MRLKRRRRARREPRTRSRRLAAGLPASALVFAGPALAWADDSMTLDLVRHGESAANDAGILSTAPPGPDLTETGQQQATDVGDEIFTLRGDDYFDGVFASELVRTQETAAPLADLLGVDISDLAGLNEIDAGISEDLPELSLGGVLYIAPTVSWILGSQLTSITGSHDLNGVEFNDRFNDAIEAMYDAGDTNDDGDLNDVAFSSELAMVAWTLMNVENPDFDMVFDELADGHEPLGNTGQIVVDGSPDDGWTLESWDGHDVDADPGLATELFVDLRDLVTAPQTAAWHAWEAVLGGDADEISDALNTGAGDVWNAATQFPDAALGDLVGAF